MLAPTEKPTAVFATRRDDQYVSYICRSLQDSLHYVIASDFTTAAEMAQSPAVTVVVSNIIEPGRKGQSYRDLAPAIQQVSDNDNRPIVYGIFTDEQDFGTFKRHTRMDEGLVHLLLRREKGCEARCAQVIASAALNPMQYVVHPYAMPMKCKQAPTSLVAPTKPQVWHRHGKTFRRS